MVTFTPTRREARRGAPRRSVAALNTPPGERREVISGTSPGQHARPAVRAKVLGENAQPNQIVKVQPATAFQKEVVKVIQHANTPALPSTVPVVPQRGLGASATVQPLRMAEHWAASFAPPSVGRTPVITYPSGALVNFQELAPSLAQVAAANAPHRARIVPAIESGDLVRQTLQTYIACDRDSTGFLNWNNGEIRNFIGSVFQQQGLSPPNEHQMYQLYAKFDADRNGVLDARECVCLVDALFRATFHTDSPMQQVPGLAAMPGLVAPPTGMAVPLQAPLPSAPVALPQMQLPRFPAPQPGVLQPPPPLGAMLRPPLGVSVPSTPGPLPPFPAPPPLGALQGPSLLAAGMEPVVPRPAPTYRGMGGSGSFSPPMPPSIAQGYDDMHMPPDDISLAGRPPPLPPAWQLEHEERPHILEVDLEELELHPAAPDMQVSWYHSVKYFVSLHPRSENPDSIPLPRDAPKATVPGQYLVSKILPPRTSRVKVGTKRANSEDEDSEDDGRQRPSTASKKADSGNPVVEFKEQLQLNMQKLDEHLVAYVWGKKSSMMDESITLVGRALAPLHDFNLQRRSITWGVFDVLESHRVAEMRARYSVATTPSAVQEPTLAEVRQTEVKIVWTPPQNDHGAPLLGYRISIMLEPRQYEEPQWFTLCECTKSSNPVYVVANLRGNKAYVVDIRAVNKVGPGDPCEFQIHTAPVDPDPPSKPWVEEARDGCVNVAWHPPLADGGSPVTAYKVRMRKILGATKWNPFGPGESKAIWVDMGSVAAATHDLEEEGTSMYNAWLGPLETTACEYRFQIVAASGVGESAGSELSDPIYT